jgi:hypothetical protein
MLAIVFFVLFSVILDAVAVGICALIEHSSEYASLLAFLGFFTVNFIFAWIAAVYVTERFFVSDAQRKLNKEHVRWVNSLAMPVKKPSLTVQPATAAVAG